MDPDTWLTWFREWLAKHPVKEPPETLRHGYTEEVMRRIRLTDAPAPIYRWAPRPRVAWALATATVCALTIVVWVNRPSRPQLARQDVVPPHPVELAQQPQPTPLDPELERDLDLLAELEEPVALDELIELTDADVEAELESLDALTLLAESSPESDDAAWIAETLQQLEELGELNASVLEDELSDEELLEELDELEQLESASVEQATS